MARIPVFSRSRCALSSVLMLVLICSFAAGDELRRPIRSLGELAAEVELDHTRFEAPDGSLTIDNQTLAACAEAGHLTTLGAPAAELPDNPTPKAVAREEKSKLKEKWRRRVLAQRRRLATAEAKLASHDARVDALVTKAFSQGSPRSRSWLKIDELKAQRPQLELRLMETRRELARIIREARKEGAQPGWFR